MKPEILYDPYFLVKNVNSIVKSGLPKKIKNGNYMYKLLNYKNSIKISENTGQLFFGKNLEIKDYVIKILRINMDNKDKNVNTSFILFVRGSDEVDENNKIIGEENEIIKLNYKKEKKEKKDKKDKKDIEDTNNINEKKDKEDKKLKIGLIEKIIRSIFF